MAPPDIHLNEGCPVVRPSRKSARVQQQVTTASKSPTSKATIDKAPFNSWEQRTQLRTDDPIAFLNLRVEEVVARERERASKPGAEPVGLDITALNTPKTALGAGFPVYENRWETPVYLVLAVCLSMVVMGFLEFGVITVAVGLVTSLVCYDLLSGVLHVVLDHPPFIRLPGIGQACLEFQWHHFIPDDIVVKGIVQACGDLHMVVAGIILYFAWLTGMGQDKLMVFMASCMILMSYFGQYSHQQSHNVSHRSATAKWLQDHGLCISPANHHKHHTAPHNTDYCLVGVCDPLVDLMYNKTPPWLWLMALGTYILGVVPVEVALMRAAGL
jgi:hypothetical protein